MVTRPVESSMRSRQTGHVGSSIILDAALENVSIDAEAEFEGENGS